MAANMKSISIEIPPDTRVHPPLPVRQFTVAEYHHLIEIGFFKPSDRLELIHGWLVPKVSHNPLHASVIRLVISAFMRLIPEGWELSPQLPITMTDSEPEPDLAIIRGSLADYADAHPRPRDVGFILEVADSSLSQDRGTKLELYAAAKIPVYWIVNIPDGRVEVYTRPRGGKSPTYRDHQDYGTGDEIPVILNGEEIGRIPVQALLPFSGT